MLETIGRRQIFEFEAGRSVRVFGPFETVWTKRVKSPDDIYEVPAAVSAAVLTRVGVVKITPEAVTRHFVVKAQRVIPDTAGSWLG